MEPEAGPAADPVAEIWVDLMAEIWVDLMAEPATEPVAEPVVKPRPEPSTETELKGAMQVPVDMALLRAGVTLEKASTVQQKGRPPLEELQR